MEITTQFGKHDVDPDTLIEMPAGLLGFENLTRFKLFHEEGKPTLFWLQSVDDPTIQFPVTDPARFNVSYELTLADEDIERIQLDNPDDLSVLVTVAKPEADSSQIHANFLAPLLINTRTRLGMQKPLDKVDSAVVIRAS